MTCTFLDLKKSKVRRLAVRSAKEMGEWIFRCLLHHYGGKCLYLNDNIIHSHVVCSLRSKATETILKVESWGCNRTCY